ncbi:hypothetical protein Ancab_023819 [Ancistrocladus abbreviatus]
MNEKFPNSATTSMFSTPFVLSFALVLTLPLIFLIAPRIFPPKHVQISLADELDDLALFRRATLASSSPSSTNTFFRLGSTNPKPKIAFLFLTNTPLSFSLLWQKFFSDADKSLYNIYIHIDPSAPDIPLTGVFKGRAIPSKRTERGSPTLISAERRLLATALIDDQLNTYFALLSQSCIPLHSFHYVYQTLYVSFNPFIRRKSYIEILDNEPILKDRYEARGKKVMMPEVPFEQFRVGSQFFILNRKHALTVIKDRRLWRKFRLPCINTDSCYPEEHYFPTLLSMKDPRGCSHYTLTRVNWTDSVEGHPHTYRPSEVTPELIYQLRESNFTSSYLFARKFSPDCLKPLMEIADQVIFRD